MHERSSSVSATNLRLVEGGRPSPSVVDEVVVARNATRGERNEPWTLRVTPAVSELDRAAAGVGIDFDLALRLAVEAQLIAGDLGAVGVALDALDRAATGARVRDALDPADAAYLRRLNSDAPRPPRAFDDLVISGLPARLSTRLLAVDLDGLVRGADIGRARAWETAAVLAGRTMSEWAPLAALAAGT